MSERDNYENDKDKREKPINEKVSDFFKSCTNRVRNTVDDVRTKLKRPEDIIQLVQSYGQKITGATFTLRVLAEFFKKAISKPEEPGYSAEVGGKIVPFSPDMSVEEIEREFRELSELSRKTNQPINLLKSPQNIE